MTKKVEKKEPMTVEQATKSADQLTCLRLMAKIQVEILEQLKKMNGVYGKPDPAVATEEAADEPN